MTDAFGAVQNPHASPPPGPGIRRPVIRQTLNGPVVVGDDPGLVVARRQAGPRAENCIQYGSPPRMATDSARVTLSQAIDYLAAAVKRNDDVLFELYERLGPLLAAQDLRNCADEAGKAPAPPSSHCPAVLRIMNLIDEMDRSFGLCLQLLRVIDL